MNTVVPRATVKNLAVLVLMLVLCPLAWSQVATVTGQAVDSDGIQWMNGTYTITFANSQPGFTPYRSDNQQPFAQSFRGTLDATGSFSVQLTQTNFIVPANSQWKFVICSAVTGWSCGTFTIPITASGSVTSNISSVILAPRVTGGPGIQAYADIEVAAFVNNSYFNIVSQVNRCYSTSWAVCSSGGGGGPPTGPAGGVLGGTYPNPGFNAAGVALPNGSTATTQACGSNLGSLATGQYVTNCSQPPQVYPGAGVANSTGSAWGVSYTVGNAANNLVQLDSGGALPNGTIAATQAMADNTTKVATDAFVLANASGFSNPMTTQGDMIVQGPVGPTRLPGNTGAIEEVLTSTTGAAFGPTTNACGYVNGGTNDYVNCSWSTAPVAGQFVACTVFNQSSTGTFAITDSNGDTYVPYGSAHLNSAIGVIQQHFYFGPLTTSITTMTATLNTGGQYMGMLCNSVSDIASSPTDGQAVGDSSGTTSPFSTAPLTTTAANDYVFCSGVSGGGSGLGAGSGFTTGTQYDSYANSLTQYKVQTTAGTFTPSMGGSVATGASLLCSAFKSGPATPVTTALNSTINIANAQAANTEIIPVPSAPSGGDDYVTLQTAINSAIAQNKALYIPTGVWKTSAQLVANSNGFRIHGSGLAAGGFSYIQATACWAGGVLVTGTGSPSETPSGWVKDIGFAGCGVPGSPTGSSGLQLNGTVQELVENVTSNLDDIGFDIINNAYGAIFVNIRALGADNNVGVNLRNGDNSGSDLTFINPWVGGQVAAVYMTSGGGGYHFKGGQFGLNAPSVCDTCGVIVMGKDYITGSTTDLGTTGADLHNVSFENPSNGWAIRAFNPIQLEFDHVPVFNYSATTLGIYENTNAYNSNVDFRDVQVQGTFANTLPGCPLISITNSAFATMVEENTFMLSPTACGSAVSTYSMFEQSGIPQYATIITPEGVSLPGKSFTTALLLANDNTGHLHTSADGGNTFTPLYSNPMTALGQILYGGSGGAASALNGNPNPTDEVLASHGSGGPTAPTTPTCQGSASAYQATCTWSTPPAAGQTVVFHVLNYNGSGTFTMFDSGGNNYSCIGSAHSSSVFAGTALTQTCYFGPLSAPITTSTVQVSGSIGYTALLGDSVGNVLSLNPSDGQCVVDSNATGTFACGTPITTTVNGDYIFCGGYDIAGTLTSGSGFTTGAVQAVGLGQYKAQSTAGAITPTMGGGASTGQTMTCTAFKPATGVAAPTFTNSPVLALGIGSSAATFAIGSSSQFSVDSSGQLHDNSTPPVVSAGTITGVNAGGQIASLSSAMSTTLTFANGGWTTWASCTATDNNSSQFAYVSAISNTAATFSWSAPFTGTLYYQCNGK